MKILRKNIPEIPDSTYVTKIPEKRVRLVYEKIFCTQAGSDSEKNRKILARYENYIWLPYSPFTSEQELQLAKEYEWLQDYLRQEEIIRKEEERLLIERKKEQIDETEKRRVFCYIFQANSPTEQLKRIRDNPRFLRELSDSLLHDILIWFQWLQEGNLLQGAMNREQKRRTEKNSIHIETILKILNKEMERRSIPIIK